MCTYSERPPIRLLFPSLRKCGPQTNLGLRIRVIADDHRYPERLARGYLRFGSIQRPNLLNAVGTPEIFIKSPRSAEFNRQPRRRSLVTVRLHVGDRCRSD